MFNTQFFKDTGANNNLQDTGNNTDDAINVQNVVNEVKEDMKFESDDIRGRTPLKKEIVKKLVHLSQWTSKTGVLNSREANIISWNDKGPRLDIRVWYKNNPNNPNEEWKAGKGVAMGEQEAHVLCLALIEAGYAPGYKKV